MSTTENETTLTPVEEAFQAAASNFEESGHGTEDETDALFAMADCAMSRANEVAGSLTERLDAVAMESASNQIELRVHAKALDAQSTINHETESVIRLLVDRIAALEAKAVSITRHAPMLHLRVSHDQVKEGHRLKETTVTYDGPWDGVDEDAMLAKAEQAFHIGQREAARRNAPQPPEIDGGELDA